MRQLKLLLAAIALLWAMPCWGKPIDLHGKWEHKKKSIPIGLPMDASIEEANRELIVNFHEDLGDVCVIVTSSTGEVIYKGTNEYYAIFSNTSKSKRSRKRSITYNE